MAWIPIPMPCHAKFALSYIGIIRKERRLGRIGFTPIAWQFYFNLVEFSLKRKWEKTVLFVLLPLNFLHCVFCKCSSSSSFFKHPNISRIRKKDSQPLHQPQLQLQIVKFKPNKWNWTRSVSLSQSKTLTEEIIMKIEERKRNTEKGLSGDTWKT